MQDILQKKGNGGKTAIVIRELQQQIALGNLRRNSLLPSERELAKELGISYMTIRRAIGQMVDDGFLVRVQGKGTFVRSDVPVHKMQQTLGIVLPAWETQEHTDLMMVLSTLAEKNGLLPRIVFCRSWLDRALTDAYESCDFLVLFPPAPLAELPQEMSERFRTGRTKVAVLGTDATGCGLDSVICDSVMTAAVAELRRQGHRKIGFAFQFEERNGVQEIASAPLYRIWQTAMREQFSQKEIEEMEIALPVRSYDLPHRKLYDVLREKAQKLPFTALILPLSFAWGGIAALADGGIRIPEDLSVLCFGDRQEAEFYRPRLSRVSVSYLNHAEKALEALRLREKDPERPAELFTVTPEIIPGETLQTMLISSKRKRKE